MKFSKGAFFTYFLTAMATSFILKVTTSQYPIDLIYVLTVTDFHLMFRLLMGWLSGR